MSGEIQGPEDISSEDVDEDMLISPPSEERRKRLEVAIEPRRLRLLQQILAHDSGVLSVEELDYRNEDITENTIDYHLRELEDHGLVEPLKAGKGADNDLPNTFWAVTEVGVSTLQDLGFYDEIAVLSAADDALERTERLADIEAYERRPSAEWYEQV